MLNDLQFGWIKTDPDPRNIEYPMRPLLLGLPLPKQKTWIAGPIWNQGRTPECAAYAGKAVLECSPIVQEGPSCQVIYDSAQKIDGIRMPHDGTTVHAVAKFLKSSGYYSKYVWPNSIDDVVKWLLLHGPLQIGIDWFDSMMKTDLQGIMHCDFNSTYRGGHSTDLFGADTITGLCALQNSWGPDDFGIGGRGFIRIQDLDHLIFKLHGECCAPTEVLKK